VSAPPLVPGTPVAPCRVLVVDDDRRVRELLEITLTTHGFAVLTASDGEEALMRARRERPDLILLDVRLPKRSGLEVCDVLRNDPTDPAVPIILITAAAEIDQRLQGFLRGADDVMGKPFSPKELVARMRRLLARATETRASARRAVELERELASARREVRRADDEARREESLLAAAAGPGRELLALLDEDALVERLLVLAQLRLKARTMAALVADPVLGTLQAHAVRGDRFERAARLTLAADGELAQLLQGLARPVRRVEIEDMIARGFHGDRARLAHELAPLVTGRWDLVMPIVSPRGLEALLLAEEPALDASAGRVAWDELALIGTFAGVALRNAGDVRAQARWLLAAAADRVYRGAESNAAFIESRRLLERSAHTLALPPAERERARHALALADWARTDEGRRELDMLCASDASGLARGARDLIRAVHDGAALEEERLVVLFGAVEAYRAARTRGLAPDAALDRARTRAESDPFVCDCLLEPPGVDVGPERDAA
jgi:two-component system, OmpR family, alkaline phosphatase synthesis response regulator PhoP